MTVHHELFSHFSTTVFPTISPLHSLAMFFVISWDLIKPVPLTRVSLKALVMDVAPHTQKHSCVHIENQAQKTIIYY